MRMTARETRRGKGEERGGMEEKEEATVCLRHVWNYGPPNGAPTASTRRRRTVLLEAGEVTAVGVDVLPQQRDLLVARLPQDDHLLADGLRRAALLLPARVGHHAVGALLVAAVDDVHPRGEVALAPRHCDVLRDGDLLRGAHLAAQLHLLQQRVDAVGVVRAHDKVDLGHAAQQLLRLLLGHAAGDDNLEAAVLPLALGLPPQRAVHLRLRLLADGARVVDQHVRVAGVLGAAVAGGLQHARHALRVGHVHLAAKGVDVVPFAARILRRGARQHGA
mmetsp:Transcript_21797/g.54945  ORF Transcript_21797/g.54945 Transcript_21797/m.54945 type:complete len:277 (-) Transcript_21797:74-904(-)